MSRRLLRLWITLLLSVAAWPVAVQAAPAPDDTCTPGAASDPKLLTGEKGLNYDLVGRAIVKVYNRDSGAGYHLVACNDEGSIDSVEELSNDQAVFAIVQSDVAHAAWFSHPLFTPIPGKQACEVTSTFPPGRYNLLLITPLYSEAVHVLLRPHLNISNLADLRKRNVWLGAPKSGGVLTAERVFGAAGVDVCELPTLAAEHLETALDDLAKLKIDALVYTGAVPTQEIQEAIGPTKELRLLPLDFNMISQLSSDASYVETMIRKDDYGFGSTGPQGSATVGVQALLVANNNPEHALVVQSLVGFLANNMDSVRRELQPDGEKISRLPLAGAPTPAPLEKHFYPAATVYFDKDPWEFWMRAAYWTAGILLAVFLLFCWKRRKIGPHVVKKPALVFGGLGIIATWVAGSFLLWAFERHVNDDFTSVARSLALIFDYLVPFVGRTALTRNGQLTLTAVKWVSLALLGGSVWPYLKKSLRVWIWEPVADWIGGGRLARRRTAANHHRRAA